MNDTDPNKNSLRLYVEDESSLVLESWNNLDDSIFSTQYSRMLSAVDASIPLIDSKESVESKSEFAWKKSVEKTSNNVFAFIGDRGAGKTSCMMSVLQMLYEAGSKKKQDFGNKYKEICGRHFYVLDTTDPSFFNQKANVLELVVGKLFMNFRTEAQGKEDWVRKSSLFELRNKLYEDFQKTLRCIANADGVGIEEDDDIVKLDRLVDAVELQSAMQRLIRHFLDYFESDMLVIPIDDMDLHTDCGYTMLEQVRKYLIQKNTLVFVSLRLDQMKRVIELENVGKYKPLLDYKMTSTGRVTEKASRYLTKLLPQSHRVFLPSMDVLMNKELEIWIRSDSEGISRQVPEEKFPRGLVKYAITSAIYKKTRYLFFHEGNRDSFIVPRNLRDLRHLVGMLYSMPDLKLLKVGLENQEIFKKYFFNTWTTTNLGQHGNEIVQSLVNVTEISRFNKTVVDLLRNKFKDTLLKGFIQNDNQTGPEVEISKILNEENAVYNVSLGDVVVLVQYLKNRVTNQYDIALLLAISTLYSIKLLDSYMQQLLNRHTSASEGTSENEIKTYSIFDTVDIYRQIVAGCLINTKYFRLMTASNGKLDYSKNKNYRDIRSIRLDKVKDAIGNLVEKDNEQVIKDHLWKAEVFALMIQRKNYKTRSKGSYDSDYRSRNEIVYLDPYRMDDNKKWSFNRRQTVYFNVASLLVNITEMEYAYRRYDNDLWELANQNEDSLLNKIRKVVSLKGLIGVKEKPLAEDFNNWNDYYFRSKTPQKDTVSYTEYIKLKAENGDERYYNPKDVDNCVIRDVALNNFEVVESLTEHLVTSVTSETSKVSDFIKNLQSFKLNTYGTWFSSFRELLKEMLAVLDEIHDFDGILDKCDEEAGDSDEKMIKDILKAIKQEGWQTRTKKEKIISTLNSGKLDEIIGMDDELKQEIIEAIEREGKRMYSKKEFTELLENVLD